MLATMRNSVGVVVTLLLLGLAAIACWIIWTHYLIAPWTRDGQVQAYVVSMAPEISGRVVAVHVQDNQSVRQGDVLYEIEPVDYQIALGCRRGNSAKPPIRHDPEAGRGGTAPAADHAVHVDGRTAEF